MVIYITINSDFHTLKIVIEDGILNMRPPITIKF